jgi:hypothetical protein
MCKDFRQVLGEGFVRRHFLPSLCGRGEFPFSILPQVVERMNIFPAQ